MIKQKMSKSPVEKTKCIAHIVAHELQAVSLRRALFYLLNTEITINVYVVFFFLSPKTLFLIIFFIATDNVFHVIYVHVVQTVSLQSLIGFFMFEESLTLDDVYLQKLIP